MSQTHRYGRAVQRRNRLPAQAQTGAHRQHLLPGRPHGKAQIRPLASVPARQEATPVAAMRWDDPLRHRKPMPEDGSGNGNAAILCNNKATAPSAREENIKISPQRRASRDWHAPSSREKTPAIPTFLPINYWKNCKKHQKTLQNTCQGQTIKARHKSGTKTPLLHPLHLPSPTYPTAAASPRPLSLHPGQPAPQLEFLPLFRLAPHLAPLKKNNLFPGQKCKKFPDQTQKCTRNPRMNPNFAAFLQTQNSKKPRYSAEFGQNHLEIHPKAEIGEVMVNFLPLHLPPSSAPCLGINP